MGNRLTDASISGCWGFKNKDWYLNAKGSKDCGQINNFCKKNAKVND